MLSEPEHAPPDEERHAPRAIVLAAVGLAAFAGLDRLRRREGARRRRHPDPGRWRATAPATSSRRSAARWARRRSRPIRRAPPATRPRTCVARRRSTASPAAQADRDRRQDRVELAAGAGRLEPARGLAGGDGAGAAQRRGRLDPAHRRRAWTACAGRCTPISHKRLLYVRKDGHTVKQADGRGRLARAPDARGPLRGHRQAAGDRPELPLRLLRARALGAPDQAARRLARRRPAGRPRHDRRRPRSASRSASAACARRATRCAG